VTSLTLKRPWRRLRVVTLENVLVQILHGLDRRAVLDVDVGVVAQQQVGVDTARPSDCHTASAGLARTSRTSAHRLQATDDDTEDMNPRPLPSVAEMASDSLWSNCRRYSTHCPVADAVHHASDDDVVQLSMYGRVGQLGDGLLYNSTYYIGLRGSAQT